MPPDASAHLVAAAHHRHELTRAKAIQALRELDNVGNPITFESVARHASVSRSWLYSQPDIRVEIERLRGVTSRAPSPPIPVRQRTSEASLLARLRSALDQNRKLTTENQRLRRQLAHALGDQRSKPASSTDDGERHNHPATHSTSITIDSP